MRHRWFTYLAVAMVAWSLATTAAYAFSRDWSGALEEFGDACLWFTIACLNAVLERSPEWDRVSRAWFDGYRAGSGAPR